MSARAKKNKPVMSARAKNKPEVMKRLFVAAIAAATVGACGQPVEPDAPPVPSWPPPSPAGMEVLPPQTGQPTELSDTDCDRTVSLRPFPTRAQADARRWPRSGSARSPTGRPRCRQQPVFLPRPGITGEITGFDVDIAGEVARDIFGKPSAAVDYRILSSADRITALQNNTVDIVVKTMTMTCERRKLVNFSSAYFFGLPTHPGAERVRKSPVRQIFPVSGCASPAAPPHYSGYSRSHRHRSSSQWSPGPTASSHSSSARVDAVSTDDAILAGLVARDPYLHLVGPNMAEDPMESVST